MKKLLFIEELSKVDVQTEIELALNETRITYSIPNNKTCLIVEGSNDAIRAAILAIKELGFKVK